jgi:hypothetical protein
MTTLTIDAVEWAKQQFEACDLGDLRRTKRLLQFATQVANHPAGSVPQQTEDWGDTKAAYRLLNNPDVTFATITAPHHQQTRQVPIGRYLVIGDTTEIDFGVQRGIQGFGPTGNGGGAGFLLHSALLVGTANEDIQGLAGQTIHYRRAKPKQENTTSRLKRRRESQIWGTVIDQVGRPPPNVQWIQVLDRGADNYEVFVHARVQQNEWVIRAAQLARKVQNSAGETLPLSKLVASLPVAGSYELSLRARPQQPARVAQLQVKFGVVLMPAPTHRSKYVKDSGLTLLPMWVIEVCEINAPPGSPPIRWVLYTSLPIANFQNAWQVIEYYEKRWLIEEWHKALKSGCGVAERQLKTKEGLEAFTGLLSVVAVRLLQLKSAARTEPNRPARELVPPLWLKMLAARLKKTIAPQAMTIREFYRGVAKLGGFLGRKSDGEPGWMTIWRGWQKLQLVVDGAELYNQE